MFTRRTLLGGAAAGAATLGLAACGGGGSADADTEITKIGRAHV